MRRGACAQLDCTSPSRREAPRPTRRAARRPNWRGPGRPLGASEMERARDESERRSIDGALRHPSQRPLRLRAWHSQLSRRVHIPSLPRHNTAPPHAYRTGHRIRSSSTSTTTPHPQLSSSEECTPQHESSAFYYRSQTPHSKSSLCHSRLCHSRSLHHPLPFAGRTSNK